MSRHEKDIPTKRIVASIEYEIDEDDFTGEHLESETLSNILIDAIPVYDICITIEDVIDSTYTFDPGVEV